MRTAWVPLLSIGVLLAPCSAAAATVSLCTGTTGSSPCPLPGSGVAGADSLVVLPGNTVVYNVASPSGFFADSGTVVIESGGTLSMTGWAWIRGLGASRFDNAGTVLDDATLQIEDTSLAVNRPGATCTITGEIDIYDDAVFHNAGSATNTGYVYTLIDLSNNPPGTTDTPTLDNSGGFVNQSPGDVPNDGVLTNSGVFSNLAGAAVDNTGQLRNTGTFLDDGAVTNARYDTAGAQIVNSGDFRISSTGSLDRGSPVIPTGSYWQTAGRTTANGLARQAMVFVMGGQLCGSGPLLGVVRVGDGAAPPAEISPGDSLHATATLAITGSLHLDGDARTTLDLAPSPNYDAIATSGPDTLGGELALRLVPGNLPGPTDTLTVLSAGAIVGTFATVTVNGAPATGAVQVLYESTRVRFVETAPLAVDPGASGVRGLRFASLGIGSRPLLALDLPLPAVVRVVLVDVAGRQVAVLQDGALGAGAHRLRAATGPPASGVYFAHATITDAAGVHDRDARVITIR